MPANVFASRPCAGRCMYGCAADSARALDGYAAAASDRRPGLGCQGRHARAESLVPCTGRYPARCGVERGLDFPSWTRPDSGCMPSATQFGLPVSALDPVMRHCGARLAPRAAPERTRSIVADGRRQRIPVYGRQFVGTGCAFLPRLVGRGQGIARIVEVRAAHGIP